MYAIIELLVIFDAIYAISADACWLPTCEELGICRFKLFDVYFHQMVKIRTKLSNGKFREKLWLGTFIYLTYKINYFSLTHIDISESKLILTTYISEHSLNFL